MNTKYFEIRDKLTFIPVLAVKLQSNFDQERWLLRRAGFDPKREYILLCQIVGGGGYSRSDVYEWGGSRTYANAHKYIEENFDNLDPGAVIDVEFILGETKQKKISDRFNNATRG